MTNRKSPKWTRNNRMTAAYRRHNKDRLWKCV